MTDRDDHSDDPSRGHVGRERGDDYDPLTDPLAAQPPSRGRRARPGPPDTGGHTGTPTGEFRAPRYAPQPGEDSLSPSAPPPGRRRRPGPPDGQPAEPPRRTGAAAALRGGRAARSDAVRGQGPARPARQPAQPPAPPVQPPAQPSAQASAADPTQDALAALANLGGPGTPEEPPRRARSGGRSAAPEEPPRRSRRALAEEEPAPRSPLWDDDADNGPTPSFLADEPVDEPRPRRGRRKREAPADPPAGRRSRRQRAAEEPLRTEESPRDTNAFPATAPEAFDSADSGAFPEVEEPRRARRRRGRRQEEEPAPRPVAEEPVDRRGRRRAGKRGVDADAGGPDEGSFLDDVPADTGALAAGAFLDDAPDREADSAGFGDTGELVVDAPEKPEDGELAGRRGRRQRIAVAEEPVGRRGRRRRGRRVVEEPEPEPVEAEDEDGLEGDEYEEPGLDDIAAAYGGSRRSRQKLKKAQKAQKAMRSGKGRGGKAGKSGSSKTRRRRSKGLTVLLALVLLLVIAGGGYGVMRTYVFPEDFSGEGSGEVVFVIEEGDSGTAVAQNLVDAGVVASVRAFINALGALDEDELGDGLVPGTYSVAEGMSGESAMAALLDPDNRLGGRVTIQEGLRNEEAIEKLAEATGVPPEEFHEVLAQTDELGLPEYATAGPAGYLFPATYRFEPDTDAGSMLRTMVTQFRQVADTVDLEARAGELGYDPNEVMAIASIIEAESGSEEDMPKISRVIHNRLEIDMNLRMDSTCFYAIGEYGIALNNEQLAACGADTSGFDTYHKSGLPPGPFVAPGQAAIEAALSPAEGDWLYFVATDPENGVTEFASTEAEFELLKAEFEATWGGGE